MGDYYVNERRRDGREEADGKQVLCLINQNIRPDSARLTERVRVIRSTQSAPLVPLIPCHLLVVTSGSNFVFSKKLKK